MNLNLIKAWDVTVSLQEVEKMEKDVNTEGTWSVESRLEEMLQEKTSSFFYK